MLFPKASLQDHSLHLTLLYHCYRQQSTSETHVACMNRVGAEGEHHKSYHVPILYSFYTHIHKNLTFKNRISCCLVNSLHSFVPVIASPVSSAVCLSDVVATASYSNHNKVMSVTTQASQKPSQLVSCLHR